jgi:hypothetical protein
MKLKSWGMVVLAAGVIGAHAGPAAAEELTVLIKATPPSPRTVEEDKADHDGLEALRKQEKDLTESLKKQFGKKEELWPADKKAERDELYLKISLRRFAYRYAAKGGATDKEMQDEANGAEATAKGTREKLDPKKGVRAVATAEEADLQIEVLGRGLTRDIMDQMVGVIGFKIVAGGRLDPSLLAQKPVAWPFHGSMMSGSSTAPVHQYSEAEPYWWIESERPTSKLLGGAGVYGKMEGQLGDSLAKLLKEQGAALVACRRAR